MRIFHVIFSLKKSFTLSLLPIIIFGIILSSCHKNSFVFSEGLIWSTSYHITYNGSPELQDSILKVLNEVGKSLSVFDPTSLVSRVNTQDSLLVDHHFKAVYLTSKKVNEKSDGLFDPTVSPLVTAWGFGLGHKATSDTTRIDSILDFVGLNKTRLDKDVLIKEDIRTQFNFSAIAKGYACDQVGEMFKRNEVKDYMVEIGGEISLSGMSPSGHDWRISIDAPVEKNDETHESFMVISLTDKGVATSGDYRNFTLKDGVKLAHTISPLTGRPALSDVLSATVIAPSCMEADAAATACMAAGSTKALEILKYLNYDGLLILADSVIITPDFKKLISDK